MRSERRLHGDRDLCSIEATIVVTGASRPIPCLIEDISPTGAKLRFRDEPKLPATFKLAMPLFAGHCEERASELRWRVGTAAGVRFI